MSKSSYMVGHIQPADRPVKVVFVSPHLILRHLNIRKRRSVCSYWERQKRCCTWTHHFVKGEMSEWLREGLERAVSPFKVNETLSQKRWNISERVENCWGVQHQQQWTRRKMTTEPKKTLYFLLTHCTSALSRLPSLCAHMVSGVMTERPSFTMELTKWYLMSTFLHLCRLTGSLAKQSFAGRPHTTLFVCISPKPPKSS